MRKRIKRCLYIQEWINIRYIMLLIIMGIAFGWFGPFFWFFAILWGIWAIAVKVAELMHKYRL